MPEMKYRKPDKLLYCDCIHEMLSSQSERFANDSGVIMFRARLEELNIKVKDFMKELRWLYSQFSYEAAHKIYVPTVEFYEVDKIKQMLDCIGSKVGNKENTVKTIQVVLKPLKSDD